METVRRPFGKPRLRRAPRERTPIPSVHDCTPEVGPASTASRVDIPATGAWFPCSNHIGILISQEASRKRCEDRGHGRALRFSKRCHGVVRMRARQQAPIVRETAHQVEPLVWRGTRLDSRFPAAHSCGALGARSVSKVMTSCRGAFGETQCTRSRRKVVAEGHGGRSWRKVMAEGHGELMRVLTSKTV
jgi:hypothetical protein